MFRYTINSESDIPIYRQLVDQINAEIRSGALATGTQMPTVRDMARQMNLSCGTVKRVYDTLREMGVIEMTRRRGSFVKYVREDRDSRKLRAMAEIDRMIHSLTDMRFSPSEIQIFLNLKMREWGLKWSGIRAALVTEYPECAGVYERQLSAIANMNVMICDLKQVREYPYSVDEQSDVILASARNCEKLSAILPEPEKLIRVAFAPDAEDMLRLSRCGARRVNVRCESAAYFDLVRDCLGAEVEAVRNGIAEVTVCADGEDGIEFANRIDAGSIINLEERINRIREARKLQPGGFEYTTG